MHITIKYTNLESTPAIDSYVRGKIGSLEKLLQKIEKKSVVEADVEIARTTRHHKKGPVFRAECNLDLLGKILRAEHSDWDARRCIDEVKKEIQAQVKKSLNRVNSKKAGKLRMLRGK